MSAYKCKKTILTSMWIKAVNLKAGEELRIPCNAMRDMVASESQNNGEVTWHILTIFPLPTLNI